MEELIIARVGIIRDEPALCEVVKRTEKRVYVRVHPESKTQYSPMLKGREPNQYVDIEDVIVEHVTVEQYERYKELYEWHCKVVQKRIREQQDEIRELHRVQAREMHALLELFKEN